MQKNPKHADITRRIEQGWTNPDIAKMYHVTTGVVAGIRNRNRKGAAVDHFWTPDDVKVLRKLVKWKWDIPSIAQALETTVNAIRGKMFREDIRYDF